MFSMQSFRRMVRRPAAGADGTGNHIVSASADRTVRLWAVSSLREREHPFTRIAISLDHPTALRYTADGK